MKTNTYLILKMATLGFSVLFIQSTHAQAAGTITAQQIKEGSDSQCLQSPVIQNAVIMSTGVDAFSFAVKEDYEAYRSVLAGGNKCLGAIETLLEANKKNMDPKEYQRLTSSVQQYQAELDALMAMGSKNIVPPVAMGIRG